MVIKIRVPDVPFAQIPHKKLQTRIIYEINKWPYVKH